MSLPLHELEMSVDIQNLLDTQGYTWDEEKKWYSRTWTTNGGQETILEVYQKKDDNWKQLMIGYGDRVFYEEPVPHVYSERHGKDMDLI